MVLYKKFHILLDIFADAFEQILSLLPGSEIGLGLAKLLLVVLQDLAVALQGVQQGGRRRLARRELGHLLV
jgi:hypothetical protein